MCLTVVSLSRTRASSPAMRGVHDDDPVLCVVDHVGELLGEEPQVEGVEDRTHRRDGEVGLEMGLVVPEEGADPVGVADPEPPECPGQPLGPLGHLGERGGDRLALRTDDGHDPAVRVHRSAVTEDPADQQWGILHRAQHGDSSPCPRPGIPVDRAYRAPGLARRAPREQSHSHGVVAIRRRTHYRRRCSSGAAPGTAPGIVGTMLWRRRTGA